MSLREKMKHYESELGKELTEISNWAEAHPQLSSADKNFVDQHITRVRELIRNAGIQFTDTVKQALQELLNDTEPGRVKKPQTRLIVTLPNNEVIDEPHGSETFLNVIKRLGLEKVKNVPNLLFNKEDLSNGELDKYTKVGSYYVNLQTNTNKKKEQLDEIASHLNIKLTVEITPKKP